MEDQQIDQNTEEIIVCCSQIFTNLDVEYQLEDLETLFQDGIYIDMFKIMFPFLEYQIQEIENTDTEVGQRLQQLIELLSSDILTMDLSHIRGDEISQGNCKHLLNFLQIIFELSKLFKIKNQEELPGGNYQDNMNDGQNIRSTPITPNMHNQIDQNANNDEERRHSVIGINQEFKDQDYPELNEEEDQFNQKQMEQPEEFDQQSGNKQNQDSYQQQNQSSQGQSQNQSSRKQPPMNQNFMDPEQQQQEYGDQQQGYYDDQCEMDSQGNLIPKQHMDMQEQYEINQEINDNPEQFENQYYQNPNQQYSNENKQYNVIQDPKSSDEYISQDQEDRQNNQSHNMSRSQKSQQVRNDQYVQEEEYSEEDNQYPKQMNPMQDSKKGPVQKQKKLTKKQQKKLIEQELFPQATKMRVLKVSSSTGKKKTKKGKKKKVASQVMQPMHEQYIQQPSQQLYEQPEIPEVYESEQAGEQDQDQQQLDQDQYQELPEMTEEQLLRYQQIVQELLQQQQDIPLDDPQVRQYIYQLAVQSTNQDENQQGYVDLNDLNMNEIIKEQIANVKDGLSNFRNQQIEESEQATTDKLMKQKNEYKYFLKSHLKEYHQKEKGRQTRQIQSGKNFKKKMVTIQVEEKNLRKEYENEQQSLYYKLRDEKINYLRKIHRIIFELEKRKIIEEKKEYKQNRQKRNEDTRNVLDSIENAYKDRITMLKDNLQDKRRERRVAAVAQREFVSRIERELRAEKQKQISQLRDQWNQEKQKFDMLMKDDVNLEKKIMELYKKY